MEELKILRSHKEEHAFFIEGSLLCVTWLCHSITLRSGLHRDYTWRSQPFRPMALPSHTPIAQSWLLCDLWCRLICLLMVQGRGCPKQQSGSSGWIQPVTRCPLAGPVLTAGCWALELQQCLSLLRDCHPSELTGRLSRALPGGQGWEQMCSVTQPLLRHLQLCSHHRSQLLFFRQYPQALTAVAILAVIILHKHKMSFLKAPSLVAPGQCQSFRIIIIYTRSPLQQASHSCKWPSQ